MSMDDIEHWNLEVCDECGLSVMDSDHATSAHQNGPTHWVEVVPLTTHQGAVDLLHEVAISGVEHEDPRIGYVVVQIDRVTWDALATYRGR